MLKIDGDIAVMSQRAQDSVLEKSPVMTLGEFAHQTIQTQFDYILAQEKGVIADEDPEYLHQMRVGFRRFQAAISVFQPAIALPKKLQWKNIKGILRVLGKLRDLDVQLMGLEEKLQKASTPGHQQNLVRLRRDLKQKRRDAYQQVVKLLKKKTLYQTFRCGMSAWLAHPKYQPVAEWPLALCLPELLAPMMSRFLLHPAWQISEYDVLAGKQKALHDLRKLCKQVRYQGEFFMPHYPRSFKLWVKDVKAIQSRLGEMQDAVVFESFIQRYQAERRVGLHSMSLMVPFIQRYQAERRVGLHSMSLMVPKNWEQTRKKYCDPSYRRQLHELILLPLSS